MKYLLLLLALPAFAADHLVIMKDVSFDPKIIEISAHDSVHWQNNAYTNHEAVFKTDKSLNSGLVNPGKTSKKITFEKPGTYDYECLIHGSSMSAKVIVK